MPYKVTFSSWAYAFRASFWSLGIRAYVIDEEGAKKSKMDFWFAGLLGVLGAGDFRSVVVVVFAFVVILISFHRRLFVSNRKVAVRWSVDDLYETHFAMSSWNGDRV